MLKRTHSDDVDDETEAKRRPTEDGTFPETERSVDESGKSDNVEPPLDELQEADSSSTGSPSVETGTDSTGWPRSAGKINLENFWSSRCDLERVRRHIDNYVIYVVA